MISEQDARDLWHTLRDYAEQQLMKTGKDFCIIDSEKLVKTGIYQYITHISNGYGHEYAMTWAKRWMKGDLNDGKQHN